jgi:hypothetical protein
MTTNVATSSSLLDALLHRSRNSEFLLKHDLINPKDLMGPRLPEDWR